MNICWQRYYLFDILDANDIKYDQILSVDADTIVHPDCPNFFEMTEGKCVGFTTRVVTIGSSEVLKTMVSIFSMVM